MLKNTDELYTTVLAIVAVSSLYLNTLFGSLSTVFFLISGGIFVASNVPQSIQLCKKNWILFLIPVWALLSSTWSDIGTTAARGSIQLILTTLFAVVIASRVNFEILLKAMGGAMLVAMLACLESPNVAFDSLTGEYNLIGIFSSKNFLATHTAMSICVALTMAFHFKRDMFSCIFGFILLSISILVLIKANSVGALFFILLAICNTLIVVLYQNLNLHVVTRNLSNWTLGVIIFTVSYLIFTNFIDGNFDMLIYSLDKDPTLTGRTLIWEYGYRIIETNPILGVGYQSLFYVGNPIAEDIWTFAHRASGAGFNFHNMFVDITVSLGFVGLVFFIFWLWRFFYRILSIHGIRYGSAQFFSILVFSFMFWQTLLEASWLRQFTITHLFICFAWVFLASNKTRD